MADFPLSTDPQLADVDPLPLRDTVQGRPVVAVQQPSAMRRAYGYLHALLASEEYSKRTLAVTDECLRHNPADYTSFAVRRKCLDQLAGDDEHASLVDREWTFTEEFAATFPKNYQLWGHRRWLASSSSDRPAPVTCAGELAFAERALKDDAKNYHAWAHRAFFLQRGCAHSPDAASAVVRLELAFTARTLDEDPFNNSAWNARNLVMRLQCEALGEDGPAVDAAVAAEAAFARGRLDASPGNEAAWSYVTDLVAPDARTCTAQPWRRHAAGAAATAAAALDERARELSATGTGAAATHALAYLLHRACQAEARGEASDALHLCRALERADGGIRAGLWRFRGACLASA